MSDGTKPDNDTPAAAGPQGKPDRRLPPALEAAYRAAIYRVELADGALELRIGEFAPRLDALLESTVGRIAVILSAENPGSRPLPAAENAARTTRLAARIDEAGRTRISGENRAPAGDFREASFLVVGLVELDAFELAREFGQAGFVVIETGQVARLVAT